MKRFFLILVLLGLLAAGGTYALLREPPPLAPPKPGGEPTPVVSAPRHGRRRAEWDAYSFQLTKGPRTRRYNLPVVVRAQKGAQPHVRLVLDVQDEANYYFVELTARGCRIGKVESGLELSLGIPSDQGLRPQGKNRLIVKRRHDTIEVVLNNVAAASAEDETFHGGRIGAGVLDGSAQVKLERPQPCDPIYFADDFMRGAAEEVGWRTATGSWQVNELRNPSLSSNAFYYVGAAAPGGAAAAAAVRGQWFWDDYRLRVAAMASETADVGIYFYYRNADNCYLFRWNGAQQPGGRRGRKQLVKRYRGKETVLAEAAGGYQPGVWYELEAEVVGQRIRTFIDGHEIFHVTDPNLCFGQIGLYTATTGTQAARFDDVLVHSVRAFHDDFSAEVRGRWSVLRGSWEQRPMGKGHARVVSAEQPARCVAGSHRWRNYTATTTVRLPARLSGDGEVGLVGHYLDEMNYVLFTWVPARGVARLEAVAGGQEVSTEQAEVPRGLPDTRHTLELEWRQNVVTARLDGQAVVSAWVPKLPRGKIGLYAALIREVAFEDVRVAFPLPPEPVLTTHEVFSRELSMQIWAGAALDWETTSEQIDGHALRPVWHRASFFGDATIELEVKNGAAPSGVPKACHLVLSAEATRTVRTGYLLTFAWPKAGENKRQFAVDLLRGGKPVAHRTLTLSGPPRRLRLERIGPNLIASVNNEQILGFRDRQPLRGTRAAYATRNLEVAKGDVKVFSDTVQVYTFSRASSDWRPAAGAWAISNRWECDPRWSFFSGMPQSSKLAAIWNKHAYRGDVCVEFAIGPKMEGRRGGSNYRYVRDFNVTLAADGRDLNSGYTFLFGGWGNSRTAITRRGKIVARTSRQIPTGGIHRRWFYVKAEKRGNTLTYSIDGTRVLSYTDPNPLTGSRVGIWTYDCGIMVSRVRINASRIGAKEPPGTPLGPCRTLYSN